VLNSRPDAAGQKLVRAWAEIAWTGGQCLPPPAKNQWSARGLSRNPENHHCAAMKRKKNASASSRARPRPLSRAGKTRSRRSKASAGSTMSSGKGGGSRVSRELKIGPPMGRPGTSGNTQTAAPMSNVYTSAAVVAGKRPRPTSAVVASTSGYLPQASW
jgi:hypothetical protein